MQKTISVLAAASLTLILSACASMPSQSLAMQKPNNQYEVTGVGKTALLAKNNAVLAANKTCGKYAAIVTNETSNYNGVFKDVGNANTGQMIETAAEVIGIFSGNSLGGLNKEDRYQSTLDFYCQAR